MLLPQPSSFGVGVWAHFGSCLIETIYFLGWLVNIFWLGRTLRPKADRNLLKCCSESTPDGLMDGRVSDFDDIFILFMKMEMESCSRLGSKHHQKLFWRLFSLYIS